MARFWPSYERFSTTRLPSLIAEIAAHEICERYRCEELCCHLPFSFPVCEVLKLCDTESVVVCGISVPSKRFFLVCESQCFHNHQCFRIPVLFRVLITINEFGKKYFWINFMNSKILLKCDTSCRLRSGVTSGSTARTDLSWQSFWRSSSMVLPRDCLRQFLARFKNKVAVFIKA